MIFPRLGVHFVSSCMSVVFSVKRAPVLKRSLWNDSPISAILMRNARNGCKKPSVSLDSKWGARQEPTLEASTASAGLAGARSGAGGLASAGFAPVCDRLLMLSPPTTEPADPGSLDAFRLPASWGDPFAKPVEPVKTEDAPPRVFRLTAILRNRGAAGV